MKKILFLAFTASFLMTACDKVKNAYPKTTSTSNLDWSLYPDGDSAYYVSQGLWPTFSANSNTLKNVLIEDFTGHRCFNCPNAATLLHNLEVANPGRVFGAGVHSSALGISSFQETNAEYPTELYNNFAFEIGTYFGSQPGSSFLGNPHGTVNRRLNGTDNTASPGTWTSVTTSELNRTLQVNLQSVAHYFSATRGLFLHVEVDKFDASLTDDIALVVYVLEDSVVGPQLMPNLSRNDTYVHKDILRDCIGPGIFGKVLTPSDLGNNGKYQINYSYALPAAINENNVHLIIYAYNKVTNEILQVIKQEI